MKKLSLATALITSLFAMGANAYQAEVGGMYEVTDVDGGEINSAAVNGKYYLNSVQPKGAPLAEAAFLNRASNIGAGYVFSKLEDDEDLAELKYNILGVTGEFFIPNTQFYVSGALNRTDLKVSATGVGSASDDGTGYALEVGFLPIEGLLLAAGVADQSESIDPIQAAKYGFITTFANAVLATGEEDDTAVTLRAKYVTHIGNHFANFEAHTYIGDETTYRLGADLYLDPTLSVGASFADTTADDSDTLFTIRAQKFLTPQIAVGANYTTVDDADSFGINGTFRF